MREDTKKCIQEFQIKTFGNAKNKGKFGFFIRMCAKRTLSGRRCYSTAL